MSLVLEEIRPGDLTAEERQSILLHAVDLHLLGSDEKVDVGFDILAQKETTVSHLFRLKFDEANVGVVYVFPFGHLPDHLEMTILIHEPFRGRHLTSQAVSTLENYLASEAERPLSLCAIVRDHNPLRKELTAFLMKHGFQYTPEHEAFIKKIR